MKRYNYFIILLILLLLQGKTKTQPTQEWVSRYHFYSEDGGLAIAVDKIGNVYVTGRSEAFTPNGAKPDYATIKYNSAGVQQWVQRYNGTGNDFDEPTGIVVDSVGNVYVTGASNRIMWPGGAEYNIVTIKYNPNGELLWLKDSIQEWVQRQLPE